MRLYHGTNVAFDAIDLTKSKPYKDFGRGFYLSPNYEQAMELAQVKVQQLEMGSPVVLSYELDEEAFNQLNVLRFDSYSEEWAKFILMNRSNGEADQKHAYDVVVGPIADDRVGAQLWKYRNHVIDLAHLVQNLKYMKGLTIQYLFATERAIKLLKRL